MHQEYFETSIPTALQAGEGELNLCDKRYKSGKQSLLWRWKNGSALFMNDRAGIREATEPCQGGMYEELECRYVQPGREGGDQIVDLQRDPDPG